MKSRAIKCFGDTNVFEEITLPIPLIKPGHVLIKVMATSVNPLDYKMRKGFFPDLVSSFPAVLHGDVAGIVEEVGAEVTQFKKGDEVYGCAGGLLELGGALSEFLLADATLIAHKPKSLDFAQAAALPLVALTAWEGLVTYANIQKDQTILIHGATGGVGHIAIQLAKSLGAKVFATASTPEKLAIAKQLGADVAINYKETPVNTYVAEQTNGAGFDVVFDTVGGENLSECFTSVALFGKIISILAVGSYDLTPAFLKGVSLHMILQPLPLITGLHRSRYGEILAKTAELVDAGIIKPLVDKKEFHFTDVGAAHDHLETGAAIGKVVLKQIL